MAVVENPTIYVPPVVSDKEGKSGYVYLVTSLGVANITDSEAERALADIEKIYSEKGIQKREIEEMLVKGFNLQMTDIEVEKDGRKGYLYLFYDNPTEPKVAGAIGCYIYKQGDKDEWFAVCTAAYSCDVEKVGRDKCVTMASRFAGIAYLIEGERKKWELEGKKQGKL